jgi:hypothetical protein
MTDGATHQKVAQIVLANVDGEPVGPASSKPAAPLGLTSALKRLGETRGNPSRPGNYYCLCTHQPEYTDATDPTHSTPGTTLHRG